MKQLIWMFLAAGMLMASTCTDDDVAICKYEGEVVDYTGLDGCGLMIKTADEVFEPVSIPDGEVINAGDKIKFNYTDFDGGSICMAGKMIEVTCLEVVERAGPKRCNTLRVVSPETMRNAPKTPYKLVRHSVEGNELKLTIQYSGCSDNKNQELLISDVESKSMPPQRAALVSFPAQPCEMWITSELCYNLESIRKPVILNLQHRDGTTAIQVR